MGRILEGKIYNAGDKKPIDKEKSISDAKFTVFKFNTRPKPSDPHQVLIITCFSEFGCETIGLHYCIPRVLQMYPGVYTICAGWYGREYLYRHLVDEFWELSEDYQFLRDRCRAFHHESKGIAKIEIGLRSVGKVFPGANMGHICLGNTCNECKHFWGGTDYKALCPKCSKANLTRSLFADIDYWRKFMVSVPKPAWHKTKLVEKYLKPNSVGIFARGRKTYGRNLPPEFYIELINRLRLIGYNPIWLGEKQSTIPCPVKDVVDFSRMPESRDLELTLAIIGKLEFTIQFWTASTRLAAMMGTPYIIFESPDQICGMQGQEGYRMALTTPFDKKKLVFAHYINACENYAKALDLTLQAVDEINHDNWDHIIGMAQDENVVRSMLLGKKLW